MKLLFFALILLFAFCGKDNRNHSNTGEIHVEKIDTIRPTGKPPERKQLITFLNGETLDVRTNFYTDSIIDSISITTGTFEAAYKHCGKGILNLILFSIMKQKNSLEYKQLKEITTAHAIRIDDQNFYFNGKNSINLIPGKEALIRVNSTIYSIFSRGNHLCNIMVLDTIHQLGKVQPPE